MERETESSGSVGYVGEMESVVLVSSGVVLRGEDKCEW